jgi:hypothetical protein
MKLLGDEVAPIRLVGPAFLATVVYWQQEIEHDDEGKESEKLQ